MTAVQALDRSDTAVAAPRAPAGSRRIEWFRDARVLTRRNLVHVRREPTQLSDVTVQPILFTLLFTQLFGAAMVLPGGGSYVDFAVAGLLIMNLATSAPMGTAVGLGTDVSTGIIDRFRTLAMHRSAIVAGRTFSDLVASVMCAVFVALAGLVVGWRPDASAIGVLAGFGVALLFGYSLSWFGACIGLATKGPESAQSIGLIILFPLAFVSNVFVPTNNLPTWLGTIAAWNPVSAVAAAVRELWGNPNPSSTLSQWPMQHPVAAALIWSIVILGVCGVVATRLFKRRTAD
ncbi:MAG TPA: ABC transporter permease [Acidimicrobiia bacterium]